MNLRDLVAPAAKALAGAAVAALVPAAARYGFDVDVNALTVALTSVLTAIGVWATANRN